MAKKNKIRELAELGLFAGAIIYLANLGVGVAEIIPDNLPLVGNLDEGLAGVIIAYYIEKLR